MTGEPAQHAPNRTVGMVTTTQPRIRTTAAGITGPAAAGTIGTTTVPASRPYLPQHPQQQQQSRHQRERQVHVYTAQVRQSSRHSKHFVVRALVVLPVLIVAFCFVVLLVSVAFVEQQDQDHTAMRDHEAVLSPLLFSVSSNTKRSTVTTTDEATQPQHLRQRWKAIKEQKKQNASANSTIRENSNNEASQHHPEDELPHWIVQYVRWHQQQRALYPGDDLFTNPNAPKLLVRTCLGLCGGLHDRLGQLPWDLYLAMKLQRILVVAWQRPKALEHFLVPPLPPTIPVVVTASNTTTNAAPNNNHHTGNKERLYLDWTIPASQHFGFDDIKRVRSDVVELFAGYAESHPSESSNQFWTVGLPTSLLRAGATNVTTTWNTTTTVPVDPHYADAKILRHRLLGHIYEQQLIELLQREGYYEQDPDHTPQQLHETPTFGNIWNLFFRPSRAVTQEILSSLQDMQLLGGGGSGDHDEDDGGSINKNNNVLQLSENDQDTDPVTLLPPTRMKMTKKLATAAVSSGVYIKDYTAVHCRVRHPKAHPHGHVIKGKQENYPADKTGLPWREGGPERQFAVETAYTALHCAAGIRRTTTPQHEHTRDPPNRAQHPPPIYFLSDSNDLVKHVALELYEEHTPDGYLPTHQDGTNTSSVYPPLLELIRSHQNSSKNRNSLKNSEGDATQDQQQHWIRARNVTLENAHIDRQKGRDPSAYYGTFVDLYITMQAQCVVYGIGYYAAFAAKLSGVPCTYLYAEEEWGINDNYQKHAQHCPNVVEEPLN